MNTFLGKIAAVSVGLMLLNGCTKDFEDMNTDPNNPTVVPTSSLLTTAQKETMDELVDEWNNGRFGMVYAQYWAQNQYTEESRYRPRTVSTNALWRGLFSGVGIVVATGSGGGGMMDLTRIIQIAEEQKAADPTPGGQAVLQNQISIAHLLRVYYAQFATDIWGEIPYTTAFQGLGDISPEFDTQESLYTQVFPPNQRCPQLARREVAASFPSGDLVYGGDVSLWKKFGNSLKLRVAMRMADANPTLAATMASEAIAAGVISNNDENALLQYGGNVPDNHPLNQDRKLRRDFSMANTLVDWLKAKDDPRLFVYADPAVNADTIEGMSEEEYIGRLYGQDNTCAPLVSRNAVSQPSGSRAVQGFEGFEATDVVAPNARAVFIDYAEVCFAIAEAAARGFVGEDAGMWYAQGIQASMEYWGISDQAAIDAYVAANPYDASNWKMSIGQQKWVALYMQGIQAWTEYRRLDFGVLRQPAADCTTEEIDNCTCFKSLGEPITNVPNRLVYPLETLQLNATSYNNAVGRQGADLLNTKLWWDRF